MVEVHFRYTPQYVGQMCFRAAARIVGSLAAFRRASTDDIDALELLAVAVGDLEFVQAPTWGHLGR